MYDILYGMLLPENGNECLLFLIISFFRSSIIKMFSSFGRIVSEDFLLHKRGPKRGEPRGYAFVQYSTKEVKSHNTKIVKPM
jgi:hypothetical protein